MSDVQDESRLSQWGALAGGLAHEIKNPLSTMNISLQLLEEDLRERPQVGSAKLLPRVELLTSEVQRLQRIVNDFLKLAKAPELDLKELDPNTLVEAIQAFVLPEFERQSVALAIQLDRAAGSIRVDPDLVRQALLNIIRNALQAMPDGGTLTVQTIASDEVFRIEFIDTGAGMDAGVRARVFDGFFSTRPGGTGIGLAITRQIIQLHGGDVICESAPGLGSKFTVTLPIHGPEGA
ncbi:MAG: two-component sensor histidine kinase [Planctomycetes bacterium]|nr:two-component sensor histidine kinase [Planctomycetota bacterium]